MKRTKLSIAVLFLTGSTSMFYSQTTDQDTIKKEKVIEGVVLQGSTNKGSESNIISLQRRAVEVIERVGSVQLEKQGVGDVSVAVTKATGAQKQEGSGQVFIRGLGDRSNSTTMNGLPIPSNDPLFKNIDLSIIKTDMIDYVGLEKVYNPNLWGDMSGANVNIVSKVYTGKPYFKVNLGSSVNFNAFQKPNFYLQNGPNFLGSKQINKPSNAAIAQYGYAFPTTWRNEDVNTPINSSLGIDFGRSFNVGEQGKLSLFGFGSFDNDYNFVEGPVRSADSGGSLLKDLYVQEYSYDTNSTGLLNLNYRINPNHTVKATTNFIHTTEQKLTFFEGYVRDTNEDRENETAFLRRAGYKTNDLWINQLSGEHSISDPFTLYWNAGYNRLDSRRPDRQQNISVYNNQTGIHHFVASNAGANHRYYDQLLENDFVGDLHGDYQINDQFKVTLGYQGRYKNSDFKATQYNFRVKLAQGNYFVTPDDYGTFFNYQNYQSGSFFDIRTFRGIVGSDAMALNPMYYESEVNNHAGFANVDYKAGDRFTAQLGVRYDHLKQNILYDTNIKSGKVEKSYAKILPALNMKYSLNDRQNFRFSASKTYTTPLLLELAPFEYEEVDEASFGNVDLNPSDNYNADLKWEWFPKRNELISITAFGKYIQNPISRVTVNSSANTVSFVNAGDSGAIYGVEAEIRKDLYNAGNSRIYTFLNATYLNTSQKLDADKVLNENPNSQVSVSFIKSEDKMQGASDFLANINLGWEQKWDRNSIDFVMSYSHISDNIYALGYDSKGNLVDEAINLLDATFRYKLSNGLGISVSGKNLLNPSFTRTQQNTNGDVIVKQYKKGLNAGLGFSYEF
ncbi:TonB-dependent receptor domain-containing protein [Chryseobacterium sp. MFBS3-17]|uniref:TonB-dependent receptor domain-containing protein n=1 Tax=Chryseobacterium sp. MFBS3-17 TaxID=2886689 RepID=UPI001D0E92FA|nr:TonB-dependent receptor [Chryseobacterium sp. MFBS3-17]MCC2590182.1 TonB-dependent receptor [Chryseobacterium sp. MFBS3-17]